MVDIAVVIRFIATRSDEDEQHVQLVYGCCGGFGARALISWNFPSVMTLLPRLYKVTMIQLLDALHRSGKCLLIVSALMAVYWQTVGARLHRLRLRSTFDLQPHGGGEANVKERPHARLVILHQCAGTYIQVLKA